MLSRSSALLCALAAMIGASPAFAGDCKSGPFAGPYIGGTVGYANSRADVTPLLESKLTAHDDSVTAGVLAGYNWQCGHMVFGVETDINYVDLNARNIDPTDGSTLDSRIDYYGTVRGRLGLTVHENMMIYGTAGFAYGGVQHKLNDPAAPGGPFAQTDSGTATGWVVGGGVEFLRHERFLIRAEALYVDLGGKTHDYSTGFCGGLCQSNAKWDDSFWTARVGVSIKLGHEEHEMEPLK